jgi:hypothetical protein
MRKLIKIILLKVKVENLKICYEPRADRYYPPRTALHREIRKERSADRIKVIKMAWPLDTLNSESR